MKRWRRRMRNENLEGIKRNLRRRFKFWKWNLICFNPFNLDQFFLISFSWLQKEEEELGFTMGRKNNLECLLCLMLCDVSLLAWYCWLKLLTMEWSKSWFWILSSSNIKQDLITTWINTLFGESYHSHSKIWNNQ